MYKDLNEAVTDAIRKLVQENTQVLIASKATTDARVVMGSLKP